MLWDTKIDEDPEVGGILSIDCSLPATAAISRAQHEVSQDPGDRTFTSCDVWVRKSDAPKGEPWERYVARIDYTPTITVTPWRPDPATDPA